MDRGFLAGLEGGLSGTDVAGRPLVEPTGAGASRDVVVEKTQKLLTVEQPHVVVGVLGTGIACHVKHLFADHETPFLLCNLGGDLLLNGGRADPFVFWNSLNVWQSVYALGFWASRNLGDTAVASVAFHEAGYGLGQAFQLGFEEAGGGRLLATEVTHRESSTEDPSETLDRLADLDPDFVLGLYSGREGVSFARSYIESGLTGTVPLISAPLMTHGHWLPRMGHEIAGTRTACSWMPGSNPGAERRFEEACTGPDARPAPDVFGLLGYEAALIIRGALSRLGGTPSDGKEMRDAMSGVVFSSPRGDMTVDADTGDVATSDHLVTVEAADSGSLLWARSEPLPLPGRYAEDARTVRAGEVKSGWVNPYLVN